MKALLALANKNKAGGVDAEEKGGWKGRGSAGRRVCKDLGEVPGGAAAEAGLARWSDDMPSSISMKWATRTAAGAAGAAVPKESKESKKRAR